MTYLRLSCKEISVKSLSIAKWGKKKKKNHRNTSEEGKRSKNGKRPLVRSLYQRCLDRVESTEIREGTEGRNRCCSLGTLKFLMPSIKSTQPKLWTLFWGSVSHHTDWVIFSVLCLSAGFWIRPGFHEALWRLLGLQQGTWIVSLSAS